MKTALAILGVFLITILGAQAALQMSLSPGTVNLPLGGSGESTVTVIDQSTGNPVPGRALKLQQWCKELQNDLVCTPGDDYNTTEVTIIVNSPTNATGQANVFIQSNGPGTGLYHYTICDAQNNGSCFEGGASVTGDVQVVPEFGVVAAGVALLGAGVFIARRRKEE